LFTHLRWLCCGGARADRPIVHGAMLENQLESSPFIYTITNTADQLNGSTGDFNQYTHTIHVNPGYHPVIPVNGSCGGTAYEAASMREVLEPVLARVTSLRVSHVEDPVGLRKGLERIAHG
jgi:hypothetical protein